MDSFDIAPGLLNRDTVESLAAAVGGIYKTHLQWFARARVFFPNFWVTTDTSFRHTIFLRQMIRNPQLYF